MFFRATYLGVLFLMLALNATAQVVEVPDPNLRAAIENALGKPAGPPITVDQMAALTRLKAKNANISDLTGLEHATNLTDLFLGDTHVEGAGWINTNSIKDLSPLAGLTNLIWLSLNQNNITDLSPLAGLTNLIWLDVGGNNVSDLSPVSGLINLTGLRCWHNNITDISPVSNLLHLTELKLNHNNISNISAVAGLTNLISLRLDNNNITDISPLAGLTNLKTLDLDRNPLSNILALAGLTHLTWLDIWGTPISDISPVANLTKLTTLGLGENNISDISSLAGLTKLTGLYLLRNHITDIASLSGLTQLETLWLQKNGISDLSPLVANTGLGIGDTVDVRQNRLSDESLYTHIPALQQRGVSVQFDAPAPFVSVPFDVTNIPEPVPPPPAVRDFFQLDPYYQQWINVGGFPVLASAEVSPYALKEAAWILGHMIGHRPDVLRVMAERTARFAIVPHNKHTSDMPESNTGRLSFFWDVRHRHVDCNGCPIASTSEEALLWGTSSMLHNFGHLLQDWGLNGVDPAFNNRVIILFDMAKAEGLYQGRYAGSIPVEYWAEGVGSWFNSVHPDNVAHTRLALKEYDPRLAQLLTEVFGDGDWRYTPPATRTHLPHLQGFNPQEAPIYQPPPELLELKKQLQDPNSDGDGKWVNLKLYDPNALSHLQKLSTGGNPTDFIFGNLTGTDLALYSFARGKKTLHYYSTTDDFIAIDTHVGAIWLIEDHTGKDLAIFRAEKEVGRVLVTPTLTLRTYIESADVNDDGNVNVLDLVLIASEFGNDGQNLAADVNRDGVINILDLILVADMFDGAVAAPSAQP